MADEIPQKTIEGLNVLIGRMPVSQTGRLTIKLGKIVAPAFSIMLSMQGDEDISALTPAVKFLFEQLPADEFNPLALELLSTTTVGVTSIGGRDPRVLDKAFGSNLVALLETIAFALEVNFGDFIKALFAKINANADAKKAAAEAIKADANPST